MILRYAQTGAGNFKLKPLLNQNSESARRPLKRCQDMADGSEANDAQLAALKQGIAAATAHLGENFDSKRVQEGKAGSNC